MKPKILIITAAIALTPLFSHSQNLNTNQEKGAFMAKCYAFGVYIMANDPDATQELKKAIARWVVNISGGAEKFISKNQFDSLMKKELNYLQVSGNGNYIRKQADQCTSILGGW